MKRMLKNVIAFSIICCVSLSGCGRGFAPISTTALESDQFGDVILDLTDIDLEYGDSVDISFSGGYEAKGVPYYPEFFGHRGSLVLTDHYENLCVAGVGCSFKNIAGIEDGEGVAIFLEKKGRYKQEFDAYNVNDAAYQMEGQSDEAFRNAREITAGRIQEKHLYRGASPFSSGYGRIELMDEYIQDNGIKCVLDLADSPEKLESYDDLTDHEVAMISAGQVIACGIGVDYLDPGSMQTLGQGLTEMAEKAGPYLIHCSLGRDRTGVVCAIIEALCGATYQEIVDDYMYSYDQLHSIDMNPDSLQYQLFKMRIDEQFEVLFDIEIDQLPESDLQTPAHDYLIRCGMTDEEIEKLQNVLEK